MSDARDDLQRAPVLVVRRGPEGVETRGPRVWASDPGGEPGAAVLRGAWAWRDGELTAEVDRYGFFSLFWYERDGVVMLSPSLLRLVEEGCDATPDRRAIATFHRLGMFVNDDTPLRHVKVLPPGGRLRWDGGGRVRVSGGAASPPPREISREAAVEGMIAHFRAAVGRALVACDGPFRLPLSGGRDSRHILLEVLHQGGRPEACVTFHHNGARPNREAQAARALCERLGVRHDVLGHPRPRMADTFRALVMCGLCADEHAQMMPLHDYFLAHGGLAFDGIAGDILTNPDDDAARFMELARKGDWRGIAQGMIEGHGRVISRPGWGRGAGPLHSPGMDEEVRDHVARAIAAHADAPDPYQMFWFYHRTRREINFVPQAILGRARRVFCPYLDPEFADFCLSLPWDVTRDRQLHNDAIARAYPRLADIPYQEGFPAPPAGRAGWRRRLGTLADALRIARTAAPGDVARAARALIGRGDRLARPHDAIYAMHAMCLSGLDADKAARLLALAARFEAARPAALVSDRFEPG